MKTFTKVSLLTLLIPSLLTLTGCSSTGDGTVHTHTTVYGGYGYPAYGYGYGGCCYYDEDDVKDFVERRENIREGIKDHYENRPEPRENRSERRANTERSRTNRPSTSMGRPSRGGMGAARMPRGGGGRRR
ncbi:MAG: hypothetical protein KBT88_00575 [Gammaproteobacteria bacterium]|nr:hypothetical protein [Gammaproteobacteria bacterium]MBQ0838247.1 hypothetical protein [Gammaproteobacteria bacterium]